MGKSLSSSSKISFTSEIAGENALILYFGKTISLQVADQVHWAAEVLGTALGDVLVDLVPSYASLLVIYDPLKISYRDVHQRIQAALLVERSDRVIESRLVTLPVYYSLESGPDLESLANRAGLPITDVIALHQQQEYRVFAIGFAPGFAYMGQVNEMIAAPRLSTPRQRVPRGAVGIADRQTAIYPAVSPGGWNLIGLCPQRMFNPAQEPSMPVQVGDRVRFQAIDRERFLQLGGEL